MTQDQIFLESEGDAWFRRNRKALESAAEHDWPLRLIDKHLQLDSNSSVLEVGCANGWRLAELERRYGCQCVGLDLSAEAIAAGRKGWPHLRLYRAGLGVDRGTWIKDTDWLKGWPYDVVICHFVLHWLVRDNVLKALDNLNRSVGEHGHLIIGDFLPDWPTKTPYHHREGLWTYKLDYAHLFEATANYKRIERVVFDHDSHEEGDMGIPAWKRCAVTLLRKEDRYEEGLGRA